MYAVIESGGKQYRVELGAEIEVDRLDIEPGESIDLARVLLVADGDQAAIGQPVVEGASVSASVVRQMRGDKVVVFKYKPKARSRVKNGHRAELTVLRIADIAWGDRSAARERAESDDRARQAADAAADAAAKRVAADQALAEQLAAKAATSEPSPDATATPARRGRAKTDEAAATDEATADAVTTATDEAATAIAEPAAETAAADETGEDA